MLTFGYYTGWRRNEILGLDWAEVDMRAGMIHLSPARSKNRLGRDRPILDGLLPVMQRRVQERMSDDVIRCLIVGSVWLVAGWIFCWARGGGAKLGGTEDTKEKSRACDPGLDSAPPIPVNERGTSMETTTPSRTNVKLFKLENTRGRQINRAVCEDCPWTYEIESAGDNSLSLSCEPSSRAPCASTEHHPRIVCFKALLCVPLIITVPPHFPSDGSKFEAVRTVVLRLAHLRTRTHHCAHVSLAILKPAFGDFRVLEVVSPRRLWSYEFHDRRSLVEDQVTGHD